MSDFFGRDKEKEEDRSEKPTVSRGRRENRLAKEASPYLLQHAHNPVDWFPWGEEAFTKAKEENKPIFLSIGYSSCHWCHVMEEESFDDEEVAEELNRGFVAVKVDKEERPDIDAVYMAVCQALTGQGGWPTTVLMTPEQLPFFAGTYFPKEGLQGRPGLMDLLRAAEHEWQKDPERLRKTGKEITALLAAQNTGKRADRSEGVDGAATGIGTETVGGVESDQLEELEADHLRSRAMAMLDESAASLLRSFDPIYGGFGTKPKFPMPHNLLFLMELCRKEAYPELMEVVEKTLKQMYLGGIFDHIGGGFSRYSTDEKWLAPHFEKMLYDNALLTMAYADCTEMTGKSLYRNAMEKTIEYIAREMTSKEGGFYAAQDADSEGEEGKYYVFRPDEIIRVLGEDVGRFYCRAFDITEAGNFEGKSIPNLIQNPDFIGDLPVGQVEKLYQYRKNRVKLHTDHKILAGWNSLMVIALAKAAKATGNKEYLKRAEQTIPVIENILKEKGGYLDDYAFFIWALIELHEVNLSIRYLQLAVDWNQIMLDLFWDEHEGGCFFTSKDAERLIYRPKETHDGALPSGNSAAAYNLVRLAALTKGPKLKQAARRQLSFILDQAEHHPAGYCLGMLAVHAGLESKII